MSPTKMNMNKSFLDVQIELLKKAIQDGTIAKDSPLFEEQKENIIQMIQKSLEIIGIPANLSQIGAEIDKRFAEEFD